MKAAATGEPDKPQHEIITNEEGNIWRHEFSRELCRSVLTSESKTGFKCLFFTPVIETFHLNLTAFFFFFG